MKNNKKSNRLNFTINRDVYGGRKISGCTQKVRKSVMYKAFKLITHDSIKSTCVETILFNLN